MPGGGVPGAVARGATGTITRAGGGVAPGSTGAGTAGQASAGPGQAAGTTTGGAGTQSSGSSASAPTTTAPTTTAPATTAPATAARQPGAGNFQPPTVSATWSVPGGGPVHAAASWSGTPELDLTVACGAARGTRSGASPLSVSLASSPAGTCQVTLEAPAALTSPVTYTLTIDPPPDGGS